MAKTQVQFICSKCNSIYSKWTGQCENCGDWNSLHEEIAEKSLPKGLSGGKGGHLINFVGLVGKSKPKPRLQSGIEELDRVCGGGLVSGAAILVGGDPGIGKSTLLLQTCSHIAKNYTCLYITGEEAIDQIRIRAARLGLEKSAVKLATATNVIDIARTLDTEKGADLVVIDSIQTMYNEHIDSSPGTVTQVRACSQELIRIAKRRGFILFLVGHVTKEGAIAGPRILEHMVDTVLYFEGERGHHFRVLRAVKNRYGPTDEIGVFEMVSVGLREIPNPSAMFLAERRGNVSGSCVFAGLEGTRPMLVEIQALVTPSSLGTARRTVVGWDNSRLSMIIAVLEARCKIIIGNYDIYLNVAGGLRISEPAADAAVATAIMSSIKDIPVPANTVVFGEIGLSGEIRSVTQIDQRIKEASKMGFTEAWLPKNVSHKDYEKKAPSNVKLKKIGHIETLVKQFL